MINFTNLDTYLKENPKNVTELIPLVKADIKYEKSRGLSKLTKNELRSISDFRNIAKSKGLFTLEHPILEDDLNLLTELEAIA